MSAYVYTALDQAGKTQKGSLQADSEQAARTQLRGQGLYPLTVQSVQNNERASHQIIARRKVRLLDLSLLTRQLATLFAAGLPVADCLQGVSEQIDKPQLKTLMLGVRAKVLEGYSLATAMGYFPQAFPEIYCSTIASGEQTGRLDVVLNRLADYIEQQQSMKQKIMQALIYPSLMTIVAIAIVSFLLAFVVPRIVAVFTSTGQSLPTPTLVLIGISDFFRRFGIVIFAGLIVLLIAFRYSLRQEGFRSRWHSFILKLPIIGNALKTINTARYTRTFGILTEAGVNVIEAMRVSCTMITLLPMRETISSATQQVKEGTPIHKALRATGYFSPIALHLLSSGEASGQLAEMAERVADNQDQHMTQLINTALTLLEPLIILLMGAVVLFIVLAVLLPIFNMNQLIQ